MLNYVMGPFMHMVVYFQVEGAQDMSAMAVPTMEQREELYDPLALPDVDK